MAKRFRSHRLINAIALSLFLLSCSSSPTTSHEVAGPDSTSTITPDTNAISAGRPLLMPVQVKDLWGYIDTTGRMVIEPKFKNTLGFNEDLAPAMVDSLWGYIDRKGNWVISPSFDSCQLFSEGKAGVMKNNLWGFIDTRSDVIVDYKYKNVKPFSEAKAGVKTSKWGFIDTTGTEIIPQNYYEVFGGYFDGKCYVLLKKGMTELRPEDNVWVINTKGERLNEQPRDQVKFSNGLVPKRAENGKEGYIDRSGKFMIKPQFTLAGTFAEAYAVVEIEYQSYGYIDTTGKVVIPAKFTDARAFSNGLAAARDKNQKWGYINKSGAWVIKPQYYSAESFSGNYAPVALKEGSYTLINREGMQVVGPYSSINTVMHTSPFFTLISPKGHRLDNTFEAMGQVALNTPSFRLYVHGIQEEIPNLFWVKTEAGWIIINGQGEQIPPLPQTRLLVFN